MIEMDETGIDDVVIEVEGAGAGALEDPGRNMVYQAARLVFQRLSYEPNGLLIREKVAIPVARGMGSSTTTIVGGLVAANALVQKRTGDPAGPGGAVAHGGDRGPPGQRDAGAAGRLRV